MKLYTNETVFRGHPDKVCDQISDALLDAFLQGDKHSRCGIEVMGGKGKIFAALTVALLGLYLLFTAQRGVVLIASGNIAGILLGAGLLLLPAVGAWALVREVIFGARIQRMAQELDAQGKLPEDTLPRSPSGRVDREAASVELEKFADVLEANPDSWEAWFNLSCMYDVCGERKRARAAMRNAISLRRGRGVTDLK